MRMGMLGRWRGRVCRIRGFVGCFCGCTFLLARHPCEGRTSASARRTPEGRPRRGERSESSSDCAHGCCVAAIGLACRGLSSRCRGPSHFSLSGQRKVTKRKATPLGACRAEARQVREGRPGFSTGHPALTKRARHPCRAPCGPIVRPSPPAQGGDTSKARAEGSSSAERCSSRLV